MNYSKEKDHYWKGSSKLQPSLMNNNDGQSWGAIGEGKIQLHRKIPKYVRTTCLAWTPREGGSVRGTTWWCPRLWPSRIGQVCRQDSTMRWWQHHEMVHEVIAEQGIWSATSYTDRQVYCRANRLRDKVVGRSRRI